eukprot:TRINITY_DN1865_c1_g2_i1.p1 TRINITY_DN1865_c1_g2~~TRINITY_DN1865_c1_g2_i1.p1  ORF type:complete len:157 (+),score=26.23 TRINITY_DN1865_c1_g2_i1:59-472(+)
MDSYGFDSDSSAISSSASTLLESENGNEFLEREFAGKSEDQLMAFVMRESLRLEEQRQKQRDFMAKLERNSLDLALKESIRLTSEEPNEIKVHRQQPERQSPIQQHRRYHHFRNHLYQPPSLHRTSRPAATNEKQDQ